MPRLRHSLLGFVRQMQMSRCKIWIFVEGMLDRSFYDSICRHNSSLRTIPFCIALTQEIPGYQGNGKIAMLQLYRWLRSSNCLIMSLGRNTTTVLFFLDKDIDDKLGTRARSTHVVYTQFYSIENYLFRFGDLHAAVQAAAQLDHTSVSAQIGSQGIDWTRRAAENWKEWVAFCLFVQKEKITGVSNYRVASAFQTGPYAAIEPTLHAPVLAEAKARSSLSPNDFDRIHAATQAHVDRLYTNDQFDFIFKGKWYAHFLAADAEQAAAGRQYQRQNLSDRLISALLLTLDYRASWSDHFHNAIDGVTRLIP